mmetsp:Transcript_28686/g.43316  ORF Transcript_28686/g.43316 Transcript_28686/m.43316 type:complete len:213 (+) Transcript_28686:54-692(+)
MQPNPIFTPADPYQQAVQASSSPAFENTGTYDLSSSIQKPKMEHIRGEAPVAMSGNPLVDPLVGDAEQERDPFNLSGASNRLHLPDVSQSFNEVFNLTSERGGSNALRKKYAQIDHFKAGDQDPFKSLSSFLQAKKTEVPVAKPEPSVDKGDKTDASTSPLRDKSASKSECESKHPTFEDQLKELREGYAKEYEEKMNIGFEELNELKKDLA